MNILLPDPEDRAQEIAEMASRNREKTPEEREAERRLIEEALKIAPIKHSSKELIVPPLPLDMALPDGPTDPIKPTREQIAELCEDPHERLKRLTACSHPIIPQVLSRNSQA